MRARAAVRRAGPGRGRRPDPGGRGKPTCSRKTWKLGGRCRRRAQRVVLDRCSRTACRHRDCQSPTDAHWQWHTVTHDWPLTAWLNLNTPQPLPHRAGPWAACGARSAVPILNPTRPQRSIPSSERNAGVLHLPTASTASLINTPASPPPQNSSAYSTSAAGSVNLSSSAYSSWAAFSVAPAKSARGTE